MLHLFLLQEFTHIHPQPVTHLPQLQHIERGATQPQSAAQLLQSSPTSQFPFPQHGVIGVWVHSALHVPGLLQISFVHEFESLH
jgi:hypothetical protein